ncbi:hypothetical protein CSC12_4111 [Klebsiella michiganensis]|nr:hypothetical protein CSC12_4111 [Klebsiella michiganensis]
MLPINDLFSPGKNYEDVNFIAAGLLITGLQLGMPNGCKLGRYRFN